MFTKSPMEWLDKEVISEGLTKRKPSSGEIAPQQPYKRPLTPTETKVMRINFGGKYKWTSIDRDGNIILLDLESSVITGKFYVTEEDLKNEIKREK